MEPTTQQQRVDQPAYVHRAVSDLSRLWNDKNVNRSGLRAAFRRWRPGLDEQPSMEMRSNIWSFVGPPAGAGDAGDEGSGSRWREQEIEQAVDRAAILVSLRAVAGDHEGAETPFGSALHQAELSDLRFMRLMTTPKSGRLESLRRALQLIDHSRIRLSWSPRNTRLMFNYLFESEEKAQWSINAWAGEFFSARSKAAAGEPDTATTSETSTTSI